MTVEYTQRFLEHQIADYRVMRADGQIINGHEYFGTISPTGTRWYNYDVSSFLERGTKFLESYAPSEEEYTVSDGWSTLVSILSDGQWNE